jgi:trehalose 6-phosphate synthase/phosphatase
MEQAITDRYRQSTRRLLLLDYDGTLAELTPVLNNARLGQEKYEMLQRLGNDPANTVVVISGRAQATLDQWLGYLPVNLAAEYGLFIKEQTGDWQTQPIQDNEWKKAVKPLMDIAVAKTPGSFMEEKAVSLVWHYRKASPQLADPVATTLAQDLLPIAKQFHLNVVPGSKVIEIMVDGVDKYVAAQHWLQKQPWDFILAAGDDTSDEILFQSLPDSAITIKIGVGKSSAHHHLASPQALSVLLRQFNEITAR